MPWELYSWRANRPKITLSWELQKAHAEAGKNSSLWSVRPQRPACEAPWCSFPGLADLFHRAAECVGPSTSRVSCFLWDSGKCRDTLSLLEGKAEKCSSELDKLDGHMENVEKRLKSEARTQSVKKKSLRINLWLTRFLKLLFFRTKTGAVEEIENPVLRDFRKGKPQPWDLGHKRFQGKIFNEKRHCEVLSRKQLPKKSGMDEISSLT